ncbi:MAG: DNRLRE domain-containing protein [Deltaproteobacteria bacterium]|nr:DNRLRE domain-containing protein [Deltaproteobacteria bacterium]
MLAALGVPAGAQAAGDPKGMTTVTLTPTDDTWATHDDATVHGAESTLKVGIQRQECKVGDPKNICVSGGQECCPAAGDVPSFCAPKGTCATAAPAWANFRSFRTYLRFDSSKLPKGLVVDAKLNLRVVKVTEVLGGKAKVTTTRLKKIGNPTSICAWSEATLNDSNGTTWSSLPQNLALAPNQTWTFDVTKAVRDWQNGDTDYSTVPVAENCGLHLYDPDFGSKDKPIERWVTFHAKEGTEPPKLVVTVAQDLDGDGATADVDCNDADKAVHPGASDVCKDGVDSDCTGADGDERCDGQDNDCNGVVDDGNPTCPAGLVCANHACIQACSNACAGPFDKKCEWDAGSSTWQVWGCSKTNGPCYGWMKYDSCNEGQFCQYGSCSSNCIDLCDEAGNKDGATACVKDSLGRWHVAQCGNWDSDSCLEFKYIDDCKPSASCSNAACVGGCSDACPKVGELTCDGSAAVVCSDSDKDGCLDNQSSTSCGAVACSAPIGCMIAPDAGGADAGNSDAAAGDALGDTAVADAELPDAGGADQATSDLSTEDTEAPDAAGETAPVDPDASGDAALSDTPPSDTASVADASAAKDTTLGELGKLDVAMGPSKPATPSSDSGCTSQTAGDWRSLAVLGLLAVLRLRRREGLGS